MLIYTAGPIGFETAYKLYKANIVQAEKQFSRFFIKHFLDTKGNMGNFDIEKTASCVYSMEMRGGGLFGCLWELCERSTSGCEVYLEKIPLKQETVEILELFRESPYEVPSEGSFLMFCDEPVKGASLIGFTNKTSDRVIICQGRRRYLTPPSRQVKDLADRKGRIE